MLFGVLGLAVAALFTGAALYVSVAEQPARLALDPGPLLAEWKPAYHNGTLMQAPLAVLGFLLAAAAWWRTGEALYLGASAAMIANMPWTLLVIFPTNRRLEAISPENADETVRTLVVRWGRLHAIRTLLGAVATVLFVAALSRQA